MHMKLRAAIAGASGYAGGEVARLLAVHPYIEVTTVTAASSAGRKLGEFHPHIGPLADQVIHDTSAARLAGHDLIILALPHGHSGALAAQLEERGEKSLILDCAADHRLTDSAAWATYYGSEFFPPWTYGMPELLHKGESSAAAQRALLSHTTRIAVPGCNVTAVTLALQPAIHAGLIDPSSIVATLSVGYSGAGKSLKPHLLAAEAIGNMAPYAVGGTHRHIPEILQNFALCGADPSIVKISFTPVLVPASRGILATVVAPLVSGVGNDQVRDAYSVYDDETLISFMPPGVWPRTAPLTGTGLTQVSAVIDEKAQTLVAIAAIDNLGKGTAAAAIQSANIALGLDEYAGIPTIGVAP